MKITIKKLVISDDRAANAADNGTAAKPEAEDAAPARPKAADAAPARPKAAKKPAYTRLTEEDVRDVMGMAVGDFIHDEDIADDVADRYEYEECEDPEGTFFVEYCAASWWDAYAFQSAVIGAAAARGLYAEESTVWRDGLGGRKDGGRRLVSVFIAAADYMDRTGHAVA